jgi:hypothetical protein
MNGRVDPHAAALAPRGTLFSDIARLHAVLPKKPD